MPVCGRVVEVEIGHAVEVRRGFWAHAVAHFLRLLAARGNRDDDAAVLVGRDVAHGGGAAAAQLVHKPRCRDQRGERRVIGVPRGVAGTPGQKERLRRYGAGYGCPSALCQCCKRHVISPCFYFVAAMRCPIQRMTGTAIALPSAL